MTRRAAIPLLLLTPWAIPSKGRISTGTLSGLPCTVSNLYEVPIMSPLGVNLHPRLSAVFIPKGRVHKKRLPTGSEHAFNVDTSYDSGSSVHYTGRGVVVEATERGIRVESHRYVKHEVK